MYKLNSVCDKLEAIMEKLDEKVNALNDKLEAIEDRAAEYDRDLTEAEEARYEKIEDEMTLLEAEKDDISSALDYLYEYVE